MAVRIHFVSGESVEIDSETFAGIEDSVSRPDSMIRYHEEGVLVLTSHVTHIEDLDNVGKPETADSPW